MRLVLLFCCWSAALSLNAQRPSPGFSEKEKTALAAALESSLQKDLLERWYPKAVDSLHGGFLSTFTFDFTPTGPQDKFIVTQARHTWTNAMAAMRYPKKKQYLQWSRHGFQFLRDVLWDRHHGGFFSLVSREGKVKSEEKTAYGNAFGIYALATYYKASRDTAALALAKKAFQWLETHSHDPVHKGYFQHLQQDGTPQQRTASTPSTADLGYKDQNSSIHLLEAFTALYEVWKDPVVRERLSEMLLLIRDRITTPRGSLTLFLQRDWTRVSFRDSSKQVVLKHKNLDHISFGHDVETPYLMLEASHLLGQKNDQKTLQVAKRMVDHALQNGWDNVLGGFYNEGYYFKGDDSITIIFDSKNWWAQAEGLNTLLLMADLFPADTMRYADRFRQQWRYITTYLIDHEHGDWYEEGLDKEPHRKSSLKGHIWKAAYHQYRALDNCINHLRGVRTQK
jgi:mannobiose 2-epimerase